MGMSEPCQSIRTGDGQQSLRCRPWGPGVLAYPITGNNAACRWHQPSSFTWCNSKGTGQEEATSCYSVFLIHIFTALPVLNPKQMVQLSPSPAARMIPGASLQRVYISKHNSMSSSYPDPEPSAHPYSSSLFTQVCPCLAPAPTGVSFSLLKGEQSHKDSDVALEAKGNAKGKNKKQEGKQREKKENFCVIPLIYATKMGTIPTPSTCGGDPNLD